MNKILSMLSLFVLAFYLTAHSAHATETEGNENKKQYTYASLQPFLSDYDEMVITNTVAFLNDGNEFARRNCFGDQGLKVAFDLKIIDTLEILRQKTVLDELSFSRYSYWAFYLANQEEEDDDNFYNLYVACNKGNPNAQLEAACRYYEINEGLEDAKKWYQAAVSQKHPATKGYPSVEEYYNAEQQKRKKQNEELERIKQVVERRKQEIMEKKEKEAEEAKEAKLKSWGLNMGRENFIKLMQSPVNKDSTNKKLYNKKNLILTYSLYVTENISVLKRKKATTMEHVEIYHTIWEQFENAYDANEAELKGKQNSTKPKKQQQPTRSEAKQNPTKPTIATPDLKESKTQYISTKPTALQNSKELETQHTPKKSETQPTSIETDVKIAKTKRKRKKKKNQELPIVEEMPMEAQKPQTAIESQELHRVEETNSLPAPKKPKRSLTDINDRKRAKQEEANQLLKKQAAQRAREIEEQRHLKDLANTEKQRQENRTKQDQDKIKAKGNSTYKQEGGPAQSAPEHKSEKFYQKILKNPKSESPQPLKETNKKDQDKETRKRKKYGESMPLTKWQPQVVSPHQALPQSMSIGNLFRQSLQESIRAEGFLNFFALLIQQETRELFQRWGTNQPPYSEKLESPYLHACAKELAKELRQDLAALPDEECTQEACIRATEAQARTFVQKLNSSDIATLTQYSFMPTSSENKGF